MHICLYAYVYRHTSPNISTYRYIYMYIQIYVIIYTSVHKYERLPPKNARRVQFSFYFAQH